MRSPGNATAHRNLKWRPANSPSSRWMNTTSRAPFPLPLREREGAAKRRKGEGVVGYDQATLTKAKNLRREMTDAERRLWSVLRNSQLDGAKFRRQQPIGPFIADFVCQQARLIVEADGGQPSENASDARGPV